MKKTELKIFELLIKEKLSISQLAQKLELSLSTISEPVTILENRGLVAKERSGINVIVKHTEDILTNEMIKIGNRFSLEKLLSDSNEYVLVELHEEKTFDELQEKTHLSTTYIYKILTELLEMGAIKREKGKFRASEQLHYLIVLLRKIHERENVEPGAAVLFSNDYKLKKSPQNQLLKGTPTAFSAFHDFGIDYLSPFNYAIWPEKKLTPEEVLVHALKCSENKKDILICMIFYLRNKRRIDMHECRKIAEHFGVIEAMLDTLAYLDQRPVKNESLFLPWEEFRAKAADYGIKAKVKYKIDTLGKLLEELGNAFVLPTNVYLIGGCNLALRGIKASTKDIDLVVKDKNTFRTVESTFKLIGFEPLKSFSKAYQDMQPSAIFEKPGYPRIDVFTRTVCGALTLNDRMVDRSRELHYGNLSVGLVRLEDIILFKAITEREGDLEDAADIIRKEKIDWDVLFEELLAQEEATGKTFCFDVLDSLELLEERYGQKIRVVKRLSKHCLEQGIMIALEKPRSVKEIKSLIDFSETMIRNALVSLLRKKKIKKIKGKPVRFVKA